MRLLLALFLAAPAFAAGEPPEEPPRGQQPAAEAPLNEEEVRPLLALESDAFSFADGKLSLTVGDERVDVPPEHARKMLRMLEVQRALNAGERPRPEQVNAVILDMRAHPTHYAHGGDDRAERGRRLARDLEHLAYGQGVALGYEPKGFRLPAQPAGVGMAGAGLGIGAPATSGGFSARDEAEIAKPRAQRRVSSRIAAVPGPAAPSHPAITPAAARQIAGFRRAIDGKDEQFRGKFEAVHGRRPQGSWGNNCFGETCGLWAQTERGLMNQLGMNKNFPDLEIVTLYQPGTVEDVPLLGSMPVVGRAGNHEMVGILAPNENGEKVLVGFVDGWSKREGESVYSDFTGIDNLPLDRGWLGVITGDGRQYKVGDDGLPLR